MNHVAVRFEHVDFINGLNWLHVEFLERRLEPLVVTESGRSGLTLLASRAANAFPKKTSQSRLVQFWYLVFRVAHYVT